MRASPIAPPAGFVDRDSVGAPNRNDTRLAAAEFGENSKVVEIDLDETGSHASRAALIRTMRTVSASGPKWVADAPRPYLVPDGTANAKYGLAPAVRYDETSQRLKLTGYIRGNAPWNVHHLVHVPHLGTYAVENVVSAGVERRKKNGKRNDDGSNVEMDDAPPLDGEGIVLAAADPDEREPLEMFASPDALEGEQNLIGFDDEDPERFEDERDAPADESSALRPGSARPAGWSDYQSAWLDALGDDPDDARDHGELADALNRKKGDDDVGGHDVLMDDEEEDRRATSAQRKKDRRDDLEFPDEAAVEEEGNARDRYARYRSLKSFRNSRWDPKENLPETYGAVYHFANFKATQKDVMLEMKETRDLVMNRAFGVGKGGGKRKDGDVEMKQDSEDEEEEAIVRACVPSGSYVTITLEGVPASAYSKLSPDAILTAVSLLPHENKISVLHMAMSQTSKCDNDDEVPVKSKDVLTFRCGWRTWQARPIFSQNNLNSDKHKFERFMPTGGAFFATTVFGPVTYAPCPVLMFREGEGHGKTRQLLAYGSMIGADADRIVLKRIVLTGHPTRVHKRHATVKYMFYNPEDVKVGLLLYG